MLMLSEQTYHDIELVKTTLKDCRSDCNFFHAPVYGEAAIHDATMQPATAVCNNVIYNFVAGTRPASPNLTFSCHVKLESCH